LGGGDLEKTRVFSGGDCGLGFEGSVIFSGGGLEKTRTMWGLARP